MKNLQLLCMLFAFVLFCISAYVSDNMSQKLMAAGLASMVAASAIV